MDVLSLAQQYVELQAEGGRAWRGDCPRCHHKGGFVVAEDKRRNGWRWWANCCGDRRGGDAHDLIKWLGLRRKELAERSTSFSPSGETTPRLPVKEQFDAAYWRRLLYGTQRNLTPDSEVGAYLLGRELQPDTWRRFGLGAGHRAGKPAILIPWFVGGHLRGGRYRLLNPVTKKERYSWWKGSDTDKRLFGSHVLQNRHILVICEGELNGMSIYQATGGAVDILSTGSENATPPTSARWALAWSDVLCWFDKEERAGAWATALHGRAISLRGADANDLLKAGELAEFLRYTMKVKKERC